MYNWMSLEEYYVSTDALTVPMTAVPCKVVAVVGGADDWSAYRGPSDWTNEQVARQGDKIAKEAAEALFPTMRDLGLRWRY